jgi:hypothetical protein
MDDLDVREDEFEANEQYSAHPLVGNNEVDSDDISWSIENNGNTWRPDYDEEDPDYYPWVNDVDSYRWHLDDEGETHCVGHETNKWIIEPNGDKYTIDSNGNELWVGDDETDGTPAEPWQVTTPRDVYEF